MAEAAEKADDWDPFDQKIRGKPKPQKYVDFFCYRRIMNLFYTLNSDGITFFGPPV